MTWIKIKIKTQQSEHKQLGLKKWLVDLNRHFTKEDMQMSNKHMKKMLYIFSNVKEKWQSKTLVTYHYTPIRIAKSRTLTPNAGEHVEQQELSFIAGENIEWYDPFGRQFGNFLYSYQKIQQLHSLVLKTYVHAKTYTQMFIVTLFIIAKTYQDVLQQVNGYINSNQLSSVQSLSCV